MVTREWTECEVELTRDDLTEKQAKAVFEAVETVLFAAGAEPSSSVAKIARALGQDGGDVVRVVSPEHAAVTSDDAADAASAGFAPGAGESEGEQPSGKGSSNDEGSSKDTSSSKNKGSGKKKDKGSAKGKSSKNGKDTKNGKSSAGSGGGHAKGNDAASSSDTGDRGERTGADVLAEMISHLTSQLQRWDFAVRIEAEDSVHQMRVRSRALRSVLQASRGFVAEEVVADMEQRLKDLSLIHI